MREFCYCGRYGDIEDRDLVFGLKGDIGLRCPRCGHVGALGWQSPQEQAAVWTEIQRRQTAALAPLAHLELVPSA